MDENDFDFNSEKPFDFEAARRRERELEAQLADVAAGIKREETLKAEADRRIREKDRDEAILKSLERADIKFSQQTITAPDALLILRSGVVWDEDVKGFAGRDGQTVDEYIRSAVEERPVWRGQSQKAVKAPKREELDTKNIRPGMTIEERRQFGKRIAELAEESERGGKGGQI